MTPPPGFDRSAESLFDLRRPLSGGPTDDRRQAAAQRQAERRQRVRKVRKWVVGIGVAVFLAAWALIFANVVLGHDPALSKSTAAAASTESSTSSGSGSSDSTPSTSGGSRSGGSTSGGSRSGGSTDSSSGSSSSGQSSSSSPSSVTTSQS